MVINKKVLRTILDNKAQYIGSLVLIIISCLLFTMLNQLAINMNASSEDFRESYVQEDASFISDRRLENLEALEANFNILIEHNKVVDYSISEEVIIRVFSEGTKVNKPAVIKGEAVGENGVMLDPAFAEANKLEIGDSITLLGRSFTISGYASMPNYIYPIKEETDLLNNPNAFGIAIISKAAFDEVKQGSSFYSIRFNDSEMLEQRMAQFKDYLKSQNVSILKWTNTSENPRVTLVSTKIEGMNQASSAMPVVILLLSCVLTGIVIRKMLKRESVVIGTMYALGYRKLEIIKHYMRYPMLIALSGGIVGTILGAFTMNPMLKLMLKYFNLPLDKISYSLQYVVISVFLPIVFLGVSCYFVIWKALKSSPVELMKGGKDKGKVGFLEKGLKLNKLKFATKFKVREQLRSVPRSAFLLFGVILSTVLLLYGFAAKSSIDYMIKDSYGEVFKYQYEYVFNGLQLEAPQSGERFSVSPFELKEDAKTSFAVYGVQPDSKLIYFKDKNGNNLSTDSIIITKPLADRLELKPNDSISVTNKLDSRQYSIKVAAIAETYSSESIFMPLRQYNELLGYPSDSYLGLWSVEKLDMPADMLLRSATADDFKKAFDAAIEPMQKVIGIIAFMSFLVGLLIIYVVTSLIIEENKITVSLMKVFGYRKKEVYSLILNSSSFIVILGYALGIPALLALLKVLFASLAESTSINLPVTINYIYLVMGFFVIIFAFELSKHLSKKKLNKISMNEALKASME